MRVLLVRPPRIKQAITLGEFMYSEPIGLEMIYTVLKSEGYEVQLFDMMADKRPIKSVLEEFAPEVVGLTTLCIDVPTVIALAEQVKKYDSSIITAAGGTQAWLNPNCLVSQYIDYVLQHSNTDTIINLFSSINYKLEELENSKKNYKSDFQSNEDINTVIISEQLTANVNQYITPDRSSTAQYRQHYSYFGYKPAAIMATAQGCSKACRFCLRWRIEGHEEHYFSMDSVIAEVKSIDEPTIMIYDNDFLHNSDRLAEFCQRLQAEKITKNFICYASVHSILKNKPQIKLFSQQGLVAVLVGYESFTDQDLINYQKKSTVADSLVAAEYMKSIAVDVWASFMLHPDWTIEDFRAFRKHIKRLAPQITSFSPLTPFPNLPLYQEYQDRLLVDIADYQFWSFGQVTIRPSKMSLRQYYFELLLCNIYVNTSIANIRYMLNKFGFMTIFRLMWGSSKLFVRITGMMLRAK